MKEVNASSFLSKTAGSSVADNKSISGIGVTGEKIAGNFLSTSDVLKLRDNFGSPLYVYSEQRLVDSAERALRMPSAYGHTVRFAMKACSNSAVLKCLVNTGLKIDASSGYEVLRCLNLGIPGGDIKLTSQQTPYNLSELITAGVVFNACSLNQLSIYGQLFPGTSVSLRFNPGLGSGHNNRTNVGGPSSAFGIWHENLSDVHELVSKYKLKVTGIHSHIGSGSDPAVWERCADLTLALVKYFKDVEVVNLGGGFKVARVPNEESTDLESVGAIIKDKFEQFQANDSYSRKLHLEIEPGSYFTVAAGAIIGTVVDKKSTGSEGYEFLIVDTGMTEILRPSMYGAQHQQFVIPEDGGGRKPTEYLVAGHCCESGDMLTPATGDPEGLALRELQEAELGDAFLISDTGAYCASMSAANYNSFPKAPEVMVGVDGVARLIRRRELAQEVFLLEV